MINVIFYRKSDGTYKGFSMSGHAMFGKYGKDIVCSAVSVLAINTVNSVSELTDNKFDIEKGKSGLLKFKYTSEPDEKGQLLLESLALGILGIEEEYGSKYLQVNFKEV
ncbi:MAG: ribosomal-processing cysteine protease Prp [Lachnospiraceae bacterium]|nr:ribosomal-processing cysteine protease Prp [Lachnospiraceae bacterium]